MGGYSSMHFLLDIGNYTRLQNSNCRENSNRNMFICLFFVKIEQQADSRYTISVVAPIFTIEFKLPLLYIARFA